MPTYESLPEYSQEKHPNDFARGRLRGHVLGIAQQYMHPDEAEETAHAVLGTGNHDPIERGQFIDALQSRIIQSAQNTRGQPASQASWYSLGAGDIKNHAALRHSNIINAAMGLPYTPNVDELAKGAFSGTEALSEDPMLRQAHAVQDYENAQNDQQNWGNIVSSHYPQYSIFNKTDPLHGHAAGGALSNLQDYGHGGVANSVMRGLDSLAAPYRNAMNRPSMIDQVTPTLDDALSFMTRQAVRFVAKPLMYGAQEFARNQRREGAAFEEHRPSPLSNGQMPIEQERGQRQKFLENAKPVRTEDALHALLGRDPSTFEHIASEAIPEFFDPVTVGGIALGGMGAGLKALPAMAGRELFTEMMEPTNLAVTGLTTIAGLPKSQATPDSVRAQQERINRTFNERGSKP